MFLALYLKRYLKSSRCGPFEVGHLERSQNRVFLPPPPPKKKKTYVDQPRPNLVNKHRQLTERATLKYWKRF